MVLAMDLPVDVLAEIFSAHVQGEELKRQKQAALCQRSPSPLASLCLSHVCRQWRLAAFSTPEIWRYIHIDLTCCSQAMGVARPVYLPRFALWSLQRAGVCPLQISFSNVGSEPAMELMRDLLCLNEALVGRVERLEIGLTGASYLGFLSILQFFDTSSLQEVAFHHAGYFNLHETVPIEALRALQHAPYLQSLSLARIQWYNTGGVVLDSVTTLQVDLGHKHEALLSKALHSFPNLVHLDLVCTDNIKLTDSWEPVCDVQLPHLESIAFDPRICHYYFHKLDAPKLSSFTARNFTRLSPRFLEHLPRKPVLSTLRLENFSPDEDVFQGQDRWSYRSLESLKAEWTSRYLPGIDGFVSCLRNHSEISTLEIISSQIDDQYIQALVEDSLLLQHMKTLRLHDCQSFSQAAVEALRFARSHDPEFTLQYTTA